MIKRAIIAIFFICLIYAAWQGLNLFDDRFPFGRMWETPALRSHEVVFPANNTGSVPLFGGEERYRALDHHLLVSPLTGREAEYAPEGLELYMTYCAQCHGKYLDGNGTVGQSFSPVPADLKSSQVQALSDGLLFKRISYGNPPKGRQPPLASTVEAQDRWKIIAFIRMEGKREIPAHDEF